jgi:hypothetical protein
LQLTPPPDAGRLAASDSTIGKGTTSTGRGKTNLAPASRRLSRGRLALAVVILGRERLQQLAEIRQPPRWHSLPDILSFRRASVARQEKSAFNHRTHVSKQNLSWEGHNFKSLRKNQGFVSGCAFRRTHNGGKQTGFSRGSNLFRAWRLRFALCPNETPAANPFSLLVVIKLCQTRTRRRVSSTPRRQRCHRGSLAAR